MKRTLAILLLMLAATSYAYEFIEMVRMGAAARQNNEITTPPASDNGPWAYFDFEDTAGVATGFYADVSGNARNGWQSNASFIAASESNVSACVHFDGSNDRFRIPTYTGATLTISMWANHDTFALARLITSEDYATGTRGFILFTSGQKIAIERGNGGSQVIAQDSATLSAGTWYHFAATICPTGLIVYKDGVGVATNLTISTNVPGTYTAVGILDDSPFYGPFDGLIDELKIWSNEYRTAAQVLSEFNLKKANYGK